MKSHFFSATLISLISAFSVGLSAQNTSEYTTSVVFPAGYQIGDYVEFVKAVPASVGASGYYEISISYTRTNVAAAATHIASISHANPGLWRETGRINANTYVSDNRHNFTIDCNTASSNPRFRIRAIKTYGNINESIRVYIKIRSINFTDSFTAMEARGNDQTVNKYLPMTNEWDLFVGNPFTQEGAKIGLKVKANGNVGIGTLDPTQKLTVNGTILAKEVKVESGWADFVFSEDYALPSLGEVEKYIRENNHLPGIPTEEEIKVNGVNLGEMNVKLLQKLEELTLYLIQHEKQISDLKEENKILRDQLQVESSFKQTHKN